LIRDSTRIQRSVLQGDDPDKVDVYRLYWGKRTTSGYLLWVYGLLTCGIQLGWRLRKQLGKPGTFDLEYIEDRVAEWQDRWSVQSIEKQRNILELLAKRAWSQRPGAVDDGAGSYLEQLRKKAVGSGDEGDGRD
jgi:hypothetical protein